MDLDLDDVISPWANEREENERRAALTTLFVSLPSGRTARDERRLVVESYARSLDDIPAAIVARYVKRAIQQCDWLPRIREIREGCGDLLRSVRWRKTNGGPDSDFDPEQGVVLDPEREIRWAMRNAQALVRGDPFPRISRQGPMLFDSQANREALHEAQNHGRLRGVTVGERYPAADRQIEPGDSSGIAQLERGDR